MDQPCPSAGGVDRAQRGLARDHPLAAEIAKAGLSLAEGPLRSRYRCVGRGPSPSAASDLSRSAIAHADRRNFYKGEKWSRGVKGAVMKIIVAAAVLSISLCSCSAYNDRSVHRNLVGPTVVGDGNSVLVSHVRNQADGQQLADKHCKRFGKSAQFNRMEGLRAFFDCRSPS